MSCLMHMEGILKRQKSQVVVKHISEILNASLHDTRMGEKTQLRKNKELLDKV
jgi:hypothetical protein